ncbi:hypothetical protein NBRC3293_2033 [Gluconobacter oxydans NBRC 3293]|uniref:DUF218 domain-containing protein n=1 Tax=Gluconobacter oxydans NBRC 3293 TaxID=1315969 RepID=A0A829XAS3_GLUOY|nr:hypothetical protein NBRC3293_2033 [Gluconobacter oxydans NBRC 3293]
MKSLFHLPRRISWLLCISFGTTGLILVAAEILAFSPRRQSPPASDHLIATLQQRIFPNLMRASSDSDWQKNFASDPKMIAAGLNRIARIKGLVGCTPAPSCIVEGWKITPEERSSIGERLRVLAAGRSGRNSYQTDQWYRDADALNYILSVYGEGIPPHYPQIDSMSLKPASRDFGNLVAGLQAQELQAPSPDPVSILSAASRYAAILLDANERVDAAEFPDLWKTWNARALDYARHLSWHHYPYTAIIVPGEGPEAAQTSLSALGKFRLMMAVESFNRGLAPFIIVTGGAVHPAQTHYVEAEEMRRMLIDRFGMAETNVVMEPFARHTTTNLRNASRILEKMGAPSHTPALIVTDPAQSTYIESPVFSERNLRELKCEPGTLGKRLSAFSITFYPGRKCNATDPNDPLDP